MQSNIKKYNNYLQLVQLLPKANQLFIIYNKKTYQRCFLNLSILKTCASQDKNLQKLIQKLTQLKDSQTKSRKYPTRQPNILKFYMDRQKRLEKLDQVQKIDDYQKDYQHLYQKDDSSIYQKDDQTIHKYDQTIHKYDQTIYQKGDQNIYQKDDQTIYQKDDQTIYKDDQFVQQQIDLTVYQEHSKYTSIQQFSQLDYMLIQIYQSNLHSNNLLTLEFLNKEWLIQNSQTIISRLFNKDDIQNQNDQVEIFIQQLEPNYNKFKIIVEKCNDVNKVMRRINLLESYCLINFEAYNNKIMNLKNLKRTNFMLLYLFTQANQQYYKHLQN